MALLKDHDQDHDFGWKDEWATMGAAVAAAVLDSDDDDDAGGGGKKAPSAGSGAVYDFFGESSAAGQGALRFDAFSEPFRAASMAPPAAAKLPANHRSPPPAPANSLTAETVSAADAPNQQQQQQQQPEEEPPRPAMVPLGAVPPQLKAAYMLPENVAATAPAGADGGGKGPAPKNRFQDPRHTGRLLLPHAHVDPITIVVEGEPGARTVHLKGIPVQYSTSSLRRFLDSFGTVLRVRLRHQAPTTPVTFAHIEFSTRLAAAKLLASPMPSLGTGTPIANIAAHAIRLLSADDRDARVLDPADFVIEAGAHSPAYPIGRPVRLSPCIFGYPGGYHYDRVPDDVKRRDKHNTHQFEEESCGGGPYKGTAAAATAGVPKQQPVLQHPVAAAVHVNSNSGSTANANAKMPATTAERASTRKAVPDAPLPARVTTQLQRFVEATAIAGAAAQNAAPHVPAASQYRNALRNFSLHTATLAASPEAPQSLFAAAHEAAGNALSVFIRHAVAATTNAVVRAKIYAGALEFVAVKVGLLVLENKGSEAIRYAHEMLFGGAPYKQLDDVPHVNPTAGERFLAVSPLATGLGPAHAAVAEELNIALAIVLLIESAVPSTAGAFYERLCGRAGRHPPAGIDGLHASRVLKAGFSDSAFVSTGATSINSGMGDAGEAPSGTPLSATFAPGTSDFPIAFLGGRARIHAFCVDEFVLVEQAPVATAANPDAAENSRSSQRGEADERRQRYPAAAGGRGGRGNRDASSGGNNSDGNGRSGLGSNAESQRQQRGSGRGSSNTGGGRSGRRL